MLIIGYQCWIKGCGVAGMLKKASGHDASGCVRLPRGVIGVRGRDTRYNVPCVPSDMNLYMRL